MCGRWLQAVPAEPVLGRYSTTPRCSIAGQVGGRRRRGGLNDPRVRAGGQSETLGANEDRYLLGH